MHEFSICQALLAQVADIATQQRAERVTRIRLRVGALAGVEAELLARAFSLARAGTIAAAAELVIVAAPVEVVCHACGGTSEVPVNRLKCPACGAIDVRVTAGEDLILETIDLDVADPAAPGASMRESECHV